MLFKRIYAEIDAVSRAQVKRFDHLESLTREQGEDLAILRKQLQDANECIAALTKYFGLVFERVVPVPATMVARREDGM